MVSAATSGNLAMTVIEAKLTRDTEFFGKMDPFVVLDYRNQRQRTKVHMDAGKLPKWNETFQFDIKYTGDDFNIKIFDEDITANEPIAACIAKASAFCIPGGIDDWFVCTYKGSYVVLGLLW